MWITNNELVKFRLNFSPVCKQGGQNTSMVIKIDFMVTETTELPETASYILQIVTH